MRKQRKLDKAKEAKGRSRAKIGTVPPTKIIPAKKKTAEQELEEWRELNSDDGIFADVEFDEEDGLLKEID